MRVLMLNYEYPPIGGGAANANRYLLEAYTDQDGLEVDLVTASPDGYREESLGETVRIYRLDVSKEAVHYWTQREILHYSWKAYHTARGRLPTGEYDLVHAWSGVPNGLIARALGRQYIVALRGSDVPGYNQRFTWQYQVLEPIIRKIWRDSEGVVANSEGLRDLAHETADLPIEVIPNGVAVNEFEPVYHEEGPLTVLCVARLIERKGVHHLVEAAARSDFELTLVGEGNLKGDLRQRARELGVAERVTFAGYVPHEAISDYYEAADVFVLPSYNEGMSNTVLEAMAAGLPIVTTDTGGTAELIDGNGQVIPAGDQAAIVDAVATYDGELGLRRRHGLRSREIAERVSWANVADQYTDLYRQL